MRTRVALGDLNLVRRLVLEHSVDERHILVHLVADLREIARLVRPVLRSVQSTLTRETILWVQVQRRNILDDEVAAAVRVHSVELVVDALSVVDDVGAGDLAVGDEGVVAQVIGTNEDAVDGLVWRVDHEFSVVRVVVVRVLNVGRDFVLSYGGEWRIDGGEEARCNVVVAYGAGDGVIVDVCPGILCHVLRPRASTISGIVILPHLLVTFSSLSDVRALTAGSTQPTGGAEPLLLMKYPRRESSV